MTENISSLDILNFYALSGIDEVVGDEPVNRFNVVPKPIPTIEKNFSLSESEKNNSFEPQVSALPAFLKDVQSLEELKEKLRLFDGCPLKQSAQNMVFGTGNPHADLMIIGEAPGMEEDKQGLPFVGASGHLLDSMLLSVGLKRSDVYITNVVPWRPPMNRKPSEAEISVCIPFLQKHIALVRPKVILLLGGTALSALLRITDGITKTRGYWLDYPMEEGKKETVPLMASFHPAYLLRTPAQKKHAWKDFLNIRDKLASL